MGRRKKRTNRDSHVAEEDDASGILRTNEGSDHDNGQMKICMAMWEG